jgi:hypothetical protein
MATVSTPAGSQPIGHCVQIGGEAWELAHQLVVVFRWYRDEVRGAADVDAGSIRVSQRECRSRLARVEREAAIALSQGLLHHPWWKVAPHRVRRLSSLSQTGYRRDGCLPPRRFTGVDDVTQDHANLRAVRTIAASVFRGATVHLATLLAPRVSSARFAAAGRLLR